MFKPVIAMFLIAFMTISAFSATVQAQTDLLAPGQLKVFGSSTVYPVSENALPSFQTYVATLSAPFTATTVTLNALGSGAGFSGIAKAPLAADIGASSEGGAGHIGFYSETYPPVGFVHTNPQEFKVGDDSIAIMVPQTVTWLTQASASQVADIFRSTGHATEVPLYTTWGDWASAQVPPVTLPAGAATQNIGRIGRVYSSGTFDGFNTYFMAAFSWNMKYSTTSGQTAQDWLPANYQALTSNADVMNAIQQPANAYAIAFVGLGFVQADLGATGPHNIVPIKLYNPTTGQYYLPSVANVQAGLYVSNTATPKAILRPLVYMMDGIPSASSAAAVKSLWISYVKSDPTYLTAEGFITMNRIDFAGKPSGNPNTSIGTQSIPDGVVDFKDITYFAGCWIGFYSASETLNPYGDIAGNGNRPDGKIDFKDITAFANNWIAYFA